MIANPKNTKRRVIAVAALAGLMMLGANSSLARGIGGGVGVGGGVGLGAGTMGTGVHASGSSTVNGDFGGRSNGHIGAQGTLNTNGPDAADRDFGRDRAEDRANANAAINGHVHATAFRPRDADDDRRGRHGRHHRHGWRDR